MTLSLPLLVLPATLRWAHSQVDANTKPTEVCKALCKQNAV